ncbi:hypothetical protein SBI_03893 [Streptomyces bingchenggensis BCW-1]|uniref:Uncharacterized protein n=1 Tax=Streptomyces bingchenggensis (strain BCW-1) TaxID=749414 RepID=D7CHF7_STRBB|nr:hypothetical protein SBI_03893 [Streptomyces bingchenggensis BCW-1]
MRGQFVQQRPQRLHLLGMGHEQPPDASLPLCAQLLAGVEVTIGLRGE